MRYTRKNKLKNSKFLLLFILLLVFFFLIGCSKFTIQDFVFNPEDWTNIKTDSKVNIDGHVSESEWSNINDYSFRDEDNQYYMSTKVFLGHEGISIAFSISCNDNLKELENIIFSLAPENSRKLDKDSIRLSINHDGDITQYKTIQMGTSYQWIKEYYPVIVKVDEGTGEIFIPWIVMGYHIKQEKIKVLPSFEINRNKEIKLLGPRYSNHDDPSTYFDFNSYGYLVSRKAVVQDIKLDGNLEEWYLDETRLYQGFKLNDILSTGKYFESQAFLGSDGIYIMAKICHLELDMTSWSIGNNTRLDIYIGEEKYWVSNIGRSNGVFSSMITLKNDILYETLVEVFIPMKTDNEFIRLGVAFMTNNDKLRMVRKQGLSIIDDSSWWLDPHQPNNVVNQFFVYSDGMYSKIKNDNIQQGDTMGGSLLGNISTIGFNVLNDQGLNPSITQNLDGEQRIYFQKLNSSKYVVSSKIKAGTILDDTRSRVGLIAGEDSKRIIAFVLDFKTQIHLRVMIKDKITGEWTDELITFSKDIVYSQATLTVVREEETFYFFINDRYIYKKNVMGMIESSAAGLISFGQKATFSNYQYFVDQSIIDLQISKLLQPNGKTMLTIGDSIFDFTDNKIGDMVENIARNTGYENLYIDNIGATTIAPLNNRGIVDHIDSGLYESFPEPDIILLQRGTNDCAFVYNGKVNLGKVGNNDKTTTFGAIEYTLSYFRSRYPNSRIIWSNSIYRLNLPEETHQALHDALLEIAPKYNVEVFDLRAAVGINANNYSDYLYDGIHLNDLGKQVMERAFIEYIIGENQ